MEKDRLIYKALVELANRMTAGHVNPFPRIASAIEQKNGHRKPVGLSTTRTITYVLALALALTTVAYAGYRIVRDSGLQAVDNAGLVSHLHQAAQPTLFTILPTQLATPNGLSQSQNGITVTLDWAYADSSRVDFALTVDGLNLPEGAQIGDYICSPYVTDQEHIAFIHPGIETYMNPGGSIGPNQLPGAPIELTYEYQPQTIINGYQNLNMVVDLTIGPCGPQWSVPSLDNFSGPWAGQTTTPPPLIGNYHLSFQVPVSEGLLLTPNQTVVHDGLSIRLGTLILDPSFTQVQFCYQILYPAVVTEEKPKDFDVTIQLDNQTPVDLNYSLNNSNPFIYVNNSIELNKEGCYRMGAPIQNLSQPNRVTVHVSNVWSVDSNGQPIVIAGPWEFTIDVTK